MRVEKINWIIRFNDNNLSNEMAKLSASNYYEAYDQAEKVLNEMNDNCKKSSSDRYYTLISIRNLDVMEDWTDL